MVGEGHRVTAGGVALAIGLILISGNPVFSSSLGPAFVLVLMAFALGFPAVPSAPSFAAKYMWLAAGFALIFISHRLVLGFVSWPACAYFLAKLFVGGLVIHRLGPAFPETFFRATYLLASVCLVFYVFLLATGPADFPTLFQESLIGENLKSLLVFTAHNTAHYWRLSGASWEPGAWQGILNLALLFLPARKLLNTSNLHRVFIVIFSVVLTFSTTGYVVLFLVLVIKFLELRVSLLLRMAISGLLIIAAAIIYQEADFLGDKIAEQAASTLFQEDFSSSRFGALIFDLQYIEKHPFIGNGIHEITRYADHPHLHGEPLGHGNGLSNFIASMGLFGLLIYSVAMLHGHSHAGKGFRISMLLIVLLLCFGEPFFNFALFMGIPFYWTQTSENNMQGTLVGHEHQKL